MVAEGVATFDAQHKEKIMLITMIRSGRNGLEIKFGIYNGKAKKKGWKPL